VFIDVFIGIWAVVLSAIWAWKIDKREDKKGLPLREIWERFPKFVFGYALTFGVFYALGYWGGKDMLADLKRGTEQADVFRRVFFVLTFFSIGVATNVRRLWAEGLGRLAAVYVVCLFGFVIWIGLGISWLFFHGMPAGGK
jgi:ABC-type dipeptide/oligopeptide/nickel transport system permease component